MAVAMMNYSGQHGCLPAHAIYSDDGRPLLSWRVAILPFIEQDALYKEFRLDEPWDSPHNLAFLPKMPISFAPVQTWKARSGMTYFQVFVGEGTAFEGTQGLRLDSEDFPDGLSRTLLFVSATEPVPWTKPQDLPYAPGKPLPRIGGLFKDGFIAQFCDARTHFVRWDKVTEETIRALITRNGGELESHRLYGE